MPNNTLTRCLIDGCPGTNWTDGRREPCGECVAREKRIRKLAERLRRQSHPALGRLRECQLNLPR